MFDFLKGIEESSIVTDATRFAMPTMLENATLIGTLRSLEYRDITIIRRSVRTSNCVFIESESVRVSTSSKPRVLSTSVKRYSTEVRKLVSTIGTEQMDDSKKTMRDIYQTFINYRKSRNYEACDEILRAVDVDSINFEILISLLMASFPVRRWLSYRSLLYNKVFEKAVVLYSISEANLILKNLR